MFLAAESFHAAIAESKSDRSVAGARSPSPPPCAKSGSGHATLASAKAASTGRPVDRGDGDDDDDDDGSDGCPRRILRTCARARLARRDTPDASSRRKVVQPRHSFRNLLDFMRSAKANWHKTRILSLRTVHIDRNTFVTSMPTQPAVSSAGGGSKSPKCALASSSSSTASMVELSTLAKLSYGRTSAY